MNRATPMNKSDAFYGAKGHLLSGIARALTDGKVSRVVVHGGARTGVTEFDTRSGKVHRIVLPREENLPTGFGLDAARGLMDHEDAHALFTTVTQEDAAAGPLVHRIANILEDPRVEVLKGDRYPGAKENIAALQEIGLRVTREVLANPGTSTLEAALRSINFLTYRRDLAPVMARPDAPVLLAFLALAAPHIEAALTSPDTSGVMRAAEHIEKLLKQPNPPAPMPSPKGESSDEGEGGAPGAKGKREKPKGDEGSDETEDSEAPKDHVDSEATKGSEGPNEPEAPESEGDAPGGSDGDGVGDEAPQDAPLGAGEEPSMSEEDALEEPCLEGEAIWSLDEERALEGTGGLTPAEIVAAALEESLEAAAEEAAAAEAVELLEAEKSGLFAPRGLTPQAFMNGVQVMPLAGSGAAYAGLQDKARSVSMGVRNALRQHLLAEGRTRFRGEQEDGTLDPAALYKIAAGIPGRPFRIRIPGKSTATAVTLLCDESGSMGERRGEKISQARLACTALWEGLKGLPGVSVEILGFTTKGGSRRVKIDLVKPFESKDGSAIAAMTDQRGNADGASVRYAGLRLLARKADRRILIVLSDGQPTDVLAGQADDPCADLRAAVEACERFGIETVGIGILSRAVAHYYPKHVVINQVEDLSGELLRQMVDLFKPKARLAARRIA